MINSWIILGIFLTCLSTAHDIFGQRTFRIREQQGDWVLSQPLFDAVMVAIERLTANEKKLVAKRSRIISELEVLLRRQKVYEIVVGRLNTAKAIKRRIAIVHNFLRKFS
jgi:hypothetical protein